MRQVTINPVEEVLVNKKLTEMSNQTRDAIFLPCQFDDTDEDAVQLIKALGLTKDMKSEIANIKNASRAQVRQYVDAFYKQQDYRKALREQIRSIENEADSDADMVILNWQLKNAAVTEKGLQDVLKLICEATEVGRWLLQIKGIGPVLAAGCLAYFDVQGKQYATQFISYAGLNDNNRPWLGREKSTKIVNSVVGDEKVITNDMVAEIAARTQWTYAYLLENAYDPGKKNPWSKTALINACAKIPYNKSLKTHMYKVGCAFQWLCNDPESLYGSLFSQRRVQELKNNEDGKYADLAIDILNSKNIGKTTVAYKEYSKGRLPLAHINARALRWVEKIFISHLFEEMYRVEYGKIPPRYYTLEHMEGEHNKEILPEVPYTV